MRNYIFNFEQKILLEKNINLQQALILDYILLFMQSDNAYIKNIDGKPYIWIYYQKVIQDMPILNIKQRRFQVLIEDLEKKKILQRVIDDDKCLIHVYQEKLYFTSHVICEDYLTDVDKLALFHNRGAVKMGVNDKNPLSDCTHPCTKMHPIVNYYKNKIKILINDARVMNINKDKFLHLLKFKLKQTLSPLAYDICIKNMKVLNLCDFLIVLSSEATAILEQNSNGKFEEAICDVLQLLLNELPP